MSEKMKVLTDSGLALYHDLTTAEFDQKIEEVRIESLNITYHETAEIIEFSIGSQTTLTLYDDGNGNVAMTLPTNSEITDDGEGNVAISGLTFVDDGNGNVTMI